MSIKISVGVSEAEDDRQLLEERRQSPDWLGLEGDDAELEARAPGWPLSRSMPEGEPVEEDSAEASPSVWAW